ncbi:MAG: hypothetical protein ACKPKO_21010, partial [Candidatus Fonsibacter sp.]
DCTSFQSNNHQMFSAPCHQLIVEGTPFQSKFNDRGNRSRLGRGELGHGLKRRFGWELFLDGLLDHLANALPHLTGLLHVP